MLCVRALRPKNVIFSGLFWREIPDTQHCLSDCETGFRKKTVIVPFWFSTLWNSKSAPLVPKMKRVQAVQICTSSNFLRSCNCCMLWKTRAMSSQISSQSKKEKKKTNKRTGISRNFCSPLKVGHYLWAFGNRNWLVCIIRMRFCRLAPFFELENVTNGKVLGWCVMWWSRNYELKEETDL